MKMPASALKSHDVSILAERICGHLGWTQVIDLEEDVQTVLCRASGSAKLSMHLVPQISI